MEKHMLAGCLIKGHSEPDVFVRGHSHFMSISLLVNQYSPCSPWPRSGHLWNPSQPHPYLNHSIYPTRSYCKDFALPGGISVSVGWICSIAVYEASYRRSLHQGKFFFCRWIAKSKILTLRRRSYFGQLPCSLRRNCLHPWPFIVCFFL